MKELKKIETTYIIVQQPIGTFYLGTLSAEDLRGNVSISRRSESNDGQQRDLDRNRVKEIAQYCSDPDATFPTALIISIDTSRLRECMLNQGNMVLVFDDTFGDVIDGQHRLHGILSSSYAKDFQLPVVFMLDPTVEEKAYVFSIINSKQNKVSPSLIYELFDVSTTRSPKKTAHELARTLNKRSDSPFFNRLKMLGKNAEGQEDATLSQGTFAQRVVNLISKDPDQDARMIKRKEPLSPDTRLIFRQYFIDDRDDVILKVLMNCFNALREVFPNEWKDAKSFILWKSTGFNAVIDSLPALYNHGLEVKSLKQEMFCEIFGKLRVSLEYDKRKLTSAFFGSGEAETKTLRDYIIKTIQ